MSEPYFTYILASKRNGALYVGLTSDLITTVDEHRRNRVAGLTSLYPIHRLVYFERHADSEAAIKRVEVLKRSHRQWKLELVDTHNPDWDDLFPLIASCDPDTSDQSDTALC